jgi:hypothetical protein
MFDFKERFMTRKTGNRLPVGAVCVILVGLALLSACGAPQQAPQQTGVAPVSSTRAAVEATATFAPQTLVASLAPASPQTTLKPGEALLPAQIIQVTKDTMETQPSPKNKFESDRVQMATQDLAGRLGIQPGAIAFLEFKAVVWPDGGMGCPQPGVAYTQVQTEGYLIRLGYEGKVYQYHGGGTKTPFLCEKESGLPQP